MQTNSTQRAWLIMLASAAILAITMGSRQSVGLFVAPIDAATGLGIVSISFALAVGQFMWGLAQPIFGAIADKRGSHGVLVIGTFMLAGGLALTPFIQSEWALVMTMGILSAAGAGAGSFSILIGATSQQLAPERRAFAGGFINAGGSLGQFIFAPLLQAIISGFGCGGSHVYHGRHYIADPASCLAAVRQGSSRKRGSAGAENRGIAAAVASGDV